MNAKEENLAPLKLIKKISTTKGSIEYNLCVVEGWKCFDEALKITECKEVIIIDKALERFNEIYAHKNFMKYRIDEKEFKKVSQMNSPEGIIGIFKRPSIQKNTPSAYPGDLHLGLYEWNDPNNVGAIIRSARGLGVSSITRIGNGPDFFSPKVIRTSMASVFHISLYEIEKNFEIDPKLWEIYAAEANGLDSNNATISSTKSNFLLIGNESHGFSGNPPLNAQKIAINLKNNLESLSAPIAASILIDRLKNSAL
jgi:RNA methyltransferase, TrmH family